MRGCVCERECVRCVYDCVCLCENVFMYVLEKTLQSSFSEVLDSSSLSSIFDFELSPWNI